MKLLSVLLTVALLALAGELSRLLQRTGRLPAGRDGETAAISNTPSNATVHYARLRRVQPANSFE